MYRRNAFTMIELIFVILILGILAVTAMSTLFATRDDARAVTAVSNLSTAITDLGSYYISKNSIDLGNGTNVPLTGDCFRVEGVDSSGDGQDDSIRITGEVTDGEYCRDALVLATRNHLLGLHTFGGSAISQ